MSPRKQMNHSISILDADLDDPAHQEAVRILLDAYAADPMGRGEPLSEWVKRNLIDGLKTHPTTLILLAFSDDRPAGVAVCFRGFSTFAARPLLNVHDLAVFPEFRGQGIGRRLLEETHRRAAELGCCKVTLEVRHDNHRAQRLYRSMGYGTSNGDGNSSTMLFWTRGIP
jgi:ribosomal protein S18 acetylase RimI-like enzyme